MNKKAAVTTLIVTALILLSLIFYWYELSVKIAGSYPQYSSVADINTQTAQENSAFAAAVQFEIQGEYAPAILQLQSALPLAKDSAQSFTILFHLEQDYEYTGSYANATQTLQQIVATSAYPPVTRSYAVEQLGVLYLRYSNSSVSTAIFTQAPYNNLYVATSTNLTSRNLFEYAAAIYPLPLSEYFIANSYATSIFNQNLLGQTSAAAHAKFVSLKQKLISSFQAGDTALASIAKNPPSTNYLLSVRLMRAVVLGKLQQIGDTSLGNAEQAFSSLLASYISQNLTSDGSVRLQYAYFLANVYGKSRVSDIQTILTPLYRDPTHRGVLIEPMLKAYIGISSSRTKQDLVLLSTIDPQFKAFLVSLGWTSADFAVNTASSANQ